jgi:hypothetical protein
MNEVRWPATIAPAATPLSVFIPSAGTGSRWRRRIPVVPAVGMTACGRVDVPEDKEVVGAGPIKAIVAFADDVEPGGLAVADRFRSAREGTMVVPSQGPQAARCRVPVLVRTTVLAGHGDRPAALLVTSATPRVAAASGRSQVGVTVSTNVMWSG